MNTVRNYVPKRSEDAALLARFISANDHAAFGEIVCKYEDLVWNICCRVLHNRHDAEDAFQQTFLLLATKARRIRKPNSLSSWLYGVAFRIASRIRRQRQRDMLPYETTLDQSLADDVLEFVARKNENELVSAEIMLMKEKHKTPLLMFYFMGDSTAQIAETLGITISAVEGRLRQARRTLRSQLRMRGVDLDKTCAALVVPVIAMNPSLTIATINKVATASLSSLAGTLSGYLTSLNQTGAKLMLSKFAVSISIVCVASMGIMHHGGIQEEGTQVTEVQNKETPEPENLPIKIGVVEAESEAQVESLHQHMLDVHNRLYGFWRSFANPLTHDQDVNKNLFVVENVDLAIDVPENGDNKTTLYTLQTDGEVMQIEVDSEIGAENQFVFDAEQDSIGKVLIELDDDSGDQFVIELHEEVPFLGKLPLIGNLFKRSTQEENRVVLQWEEHVEEFSTDEDSDNSTHDN